MKIVRLEAENVKRLKAVRIEPDGTMVVVGGKNGAGKSSVLDSIAYALGGKALCPSKPVRAGEATARAVVDLGELVVERTWTEKGSYLKVKNADGFEASSPQAILDRLVGRLSFDPLAFVEMSPRDQVEALRELVGLDFSELDRERDLVYRDRTDIGRDVKRLEGQLAGMPAGDDPGGPVSVSKLMTELRSAQDHNAAGERLEREAGIASERCKGIETTIAELEARIKGLRHDLAAQQQRRDEALERVQEFQPVDTEAIERQIAEADALNQRHRAAAQRRTVEEQLAESRLAYERMTADLNAMDERKRTALAEAEFPVDGLSFDEDAVLFNGIPFDQASSAEQLRVSVAMGLAANPELRVLLIRDGSLLDEDNLGLVARMAAEADAQVWIERVSTDGAGVSVMIEDGEVSGATVDGSGQPRLLEEAS